MNPLDPFDRALRFKRIFKYALPAIVIGGILKSQNAITKSTEVTIGATAETLASLFKKKELPQEGYERIYADEFLNKLQILIKQPDEVEPRIENGWFTIYYDHPTYNYIIALFKEYRTTYLKALIKAVPSPARTIGVAIGFFGSQGILGTGISSVVNTMRYYITDNINIREITLEPQEYVDVIELKLEDNKAYSKFKNMELELDLQEGITYEYILISIVSLRDYRPAVRWIEYKL